MFYLKYLKAELTRRWGNTLAIVLGLAMASAIIIIIISISNGLSGAQKKVLNPLQNVGTDAMVTRSVNASDPGSVDDATREELRSENQISTDFSKLGKPGDSFSRDVFMSGSQLTFDKNTTDKIDANLVSNFATGLLMTVTHQEGKIPNLSVDVQTGGQTFTVNREIGGLTDAEQQAIDAARAKAQQELKDQGIDPRSDEGRQKIRDASNAAMPERLRSQSFEVTAPTEARRQNVGAFSTDIKNTTFTVAGVDITKTDIGLVLPSNIVDGAFIANDDQAVVAKSYADKNGTKINDKIKLSDKELSVVGIVNPQLYSETADIYTTLSTIQTLSGKQDRINIILAKAENADAVPEVKKSLEGLFAGARVIDSQDTATQVSGSLVSAANLTNRFIGLVSAIVVGAAFVIVGLLSIISLNKRTKEIGTLKAIGWTNAKITRQIFLEKLTLGVVGALVGVALAVIALAFVNRAHMSLSATVNDQNSGFTQFFRRGGGQNNNTGTANQIAFVVNYSLMVFGLGALVSIVGSIIAGGLSAQKSLKLKPQEALRNLE